MEPHKLSDYIEPGDIIIVNGKEVRAQRVRHEMGRRVHVTYTDGTDAQTVTYETNRYVRIG